jgi:hypothetical protein
MDDSIAPLRNFSDAFSLCRFACDSFGGGADGASGTGSGADGASGTGSGANGCASTFMAADLTFIGAFDTCDTLLATFSAVAVYPFRNEPMTLTLNCVILLLSYHLFYHTDHSRPYDKNRNGIF